MFKTFKKYKKLKSKKGEKSLKGAIIVAGGFDSFDIVRQAHYRWFDLAHHRRSRQVRSPQVAGGS